MSHQTKITGIVIKDNAQHIEALRMAGMELGCLFKVNTQGRVYGGATRPADIVLTPKDCPYDVLGHKRNGQVELETDYWHGHVEKQLGHKMGLLKQGFSEQLVRQTARRQGYSIRKRVLANGTVELSASK